MANLSDSNPWASSRDGISPKILALQEVTRGGLRGGRGIPPHLRDNSIPALTKIITKKNPGGV